MEINNQMDNMLTVPEVAMLLHVHPNTLKRWSDKGIIESFRINSRGDRRYMTEYIINFLAKQNNKPQKEQAKVEQERYGRT